MKTKKAKIMVVMCLLALAGLAVIFLPAYAGDLEPSGAPGPTMKTLDEVEPRIPISASDLPLTISQSGSYYLVEDVNFTDTVNHAITIECNDVTIDLMGYTLKGPDSGSTCGVFMDGRSNVEIRNGTIRDFGDFAIFENVNSGRNYRVINIRALSNLYGICLNGTGHLVKNCTASNNGSIGIYTYSGGTVTGNTCHDNGVQGIYIYYGCTIAGNTCFNNGNYGIYTYSGCTVTGNTCYHNGDTGIVTGNGSTVNGNTCYDNALCGIYAGNYCLIDQNTAYNNGTNMYTGTGCVLGVNVY